MHIAVPERPYHLSWDLTTACNLHCSFCYSAQGKASPQETPELVRLLLSNIAELRPLHLGIGGGDPLLSPFITYVIEALPAMMKEDMPITTIDSMEVTQREDVVRLIRRENERLGEDRISLYLSIHGLGEVHDRIVGRPGHFQAQMQAIKLLMERGVAFSIGIVPTQRNYDQLDGVLTLALNLGAGLLNISQFVPVGRANKAFDDNLTTEQYRQMLDWVVARNAEIGRRYIVTHEHWMSAADPLLFRSNLFVGCSAGIYYFGVRSNGDIVPCQLNSYVLSNIRDQRLLDVWRDHPMLRLWRERRVKGRCAACRFLYKCGGCRCNAMAYTGDFLGEDVLCPFSPVELQARYRQFLAASPLPGVDSHLSPGPLTHDTLIGKLASLATRQGDALVVRNETYNTFVELTGDAPVIYDLVPSQGRVTCGDLGAAFRQRTGRDIPLDELEALVRSGVLGCSP